MAFLKFKGIGITAMAGAVPKKVIKNLEYTEFFPEDQVKEVVEKVGIYERRFADEQTCSSDLCFAAAQKLIIDNDIDRDEIDLLVFISQTQDYRMPATSITLQHRLGLKQSCIAFDVNLGCSAFIYGMSVVYSMMQTGNIRKALILDGETRSKVYGPRDRRSAFIFGDGGVAALVERDEKFGETTLSLNSDGSRADLIMIKAGGYRHMSTPETLKERVVDEYGNMRSDEQGYMKGGDVFNFVIREIPRDIKKTIADNTEAQMKTPKVQKIIDDNISQQRAMDSFWEAVDEAEQENGVNSDAYQALVKLHSTLDDMRTFYEGVISYTGAVDTAAEGAGELYDGISELCDGLNEFNEQAVGKLTSFLDDDLPGLKDRLEAVGDVMGDYQSYGGIRDDMTGTTHFIIRTEGI